MKKEELDKITEFHFPNGNVPKGFQLGVLVGYNYNSKGKFGVKNKKYIASIKQKPCDHDFVANGVISLKCTKCEKVEMCL